MHRPRRTVHRTPQRTLAARLIGLVVVWSLVASALPSWPFLSPSPSGPNVPGGPDPFSPPPAAAVHTLPPVVDPHLPSLSVAVAVAPDPVVVGQEATVSVTVTNEAPDPATDLSVLLPLPAGVTATTPTVPLPAPFAARAAAAGLPIAGWTWAPTLGANARVTVTARLVVAQPPADGALVLAPVVGAKGVAQPVQATGGALVADAAPVAATQAYAPDAATRLASADTRVTVDVPDGAAATPLTLAYDAHPPAGEAAPPEQAGIRRGLGAFHLTATAADGTPVHRFAKPVTVTARYTPAQLRARGIAEADLTLFWFDPDLVATLPSGVVRHGDWVPIPTTIDARTHTATASVDHFSIFQLSDGSSPSNLYMPSVKGWQVDTFTGHASYSVPIDVPAGPAGIRPSLGLSYNSGQSDGAGGTKETWQAGWAGKGWSLTTGAVELLRVSDKTPVMYRLMLNGKTYDLAQEQLSTSDPCGNTSGYCTNDPTLFGWRASTDSFVSITPMGNGTSATNGSSAGAYARTKWQITDKDGTVYEFADDLWWGFDECDPAQFSPTTAWMETYKWQLTKVTDASGNTITYHYNHSTYPPAATCNGVHGTVDIDSVPDWIAWGSNVNISTSVDHFQVAFNPGLTGGRTIDTAHDAANVQYGGSNGAPHETAELDTIVVQTRQSSTDTWHKLRQYTLGHSGTTVRADAITASAPKLTLNSVTVSGTDGTALPTTSFSYNTTLGSGPRIDAGANRLTQVDNGQGGIVAFSYQNIATETGLDLFDNYHRVRTVTLKDRGTTVGTWTYDYDHPEMNTLGSNFGVTGLPTWQAHPNSAVLYLNAKWPTPSGWPDNTPFLAVQAQKEFRGHAKTTVTAPNGTVTVHYFQQGDAAGCDPTATGGSLATYEGDGCFRQLRADEWLRGVEYQTDVKDNLGNLLSSTMTAYAAEGGVGDMNCPGACGFTLHALGGMWLSFVHPTQRTDLVYEGGATGDGNPACVASGTCIGKATTYAYDALTGNLLSTKEYSGITPTGAPYRDTERLYASASMAIGIGGYPANPTTRLAEEKLLDGSGATRAWTRYFYDGQTFLHTLATARLTKTSAFYDVASPHSSDTTYGYDGYGNRNAVATYTGADGGGTPRSTNTTYDGTFNDLPIRVDTGVVSGVAILTEYASYDPVTRWMASLTDANGQQTTATYDVFGRIASLIRPGDTTTNATNFFSYDDWHLPVRASVAQRSDAGYGWASHFYDGLGRTIQTKVMSQTNAQNIITDTVYDALGNPTQVSQPRYVNETPANTFWTWDAPGAGLIWTTTTYDPLSRPRTVTAPDGTTTQASYSRDATGTIVTATDAKAHRTASTTDLFGRLITVVESSGDGNPSGEGSYATYATTTYQYDVRDLRTKITDTQSHQTSFAYDGLGYLLSQADPDLGTSVYQYDGAGRLTQQTDAKSQTIGFGYDALDRLTARTGSDTATFSYDDTTGGNLGKGHRTAMSNSAGGTTWVYDNRGRATSARVTANVPGGSVGPWTVATGYDSADRMKNLTYPTGEALTYTYDVAGRPTSLCSSLSVCYVSTTSPATYTALGQPLMRTLGNTTVEQWSYTAPMQRLTRIQQGTLPSSPSILDDRTYEYDAVGNVTRIHDGLSLLDQRFTYDHRDRLTHACTASSTPPYPCGSGVSGGYDETYAYDTIGNLTSKTPTGGTATTYAYGLSGHAHAPQSVGGDPYAYDANGNVMSGAGRAYTWNALNLPLTITNTGITGTPNVSAPGRAMPTAAGTPNVGPPVRGMPTMAGTPNVGVPPRPNPTGGTETYTYDADGNRLTRTANGTTTVYVGGVYEADVSGTTTVWTRVQYGFGGGVVAQRATSGTNALIYLHSDHLGSVGVATTSTGGFLDRAEYGPWGNVRTGGVPETTLSFTGQKRDGTGLLYYGARYYDPVLGRFLSPDSIIPGGGINPQMLNRYAYVGNNPINQTDPTGHCGYGDGSDCNPHADDRDPHESPGNDTNPDTFTDPSDPRAGERNDDRDVGGDNGGDDGIVRVGAASVSTFSLNPKVSFILLKDCAQDGGSTNCVKNGCDPRICPNVGGPQPPAANTGFVKVSGPFGTVVKRSDSSAGSGAPGGNGGNGPWGKNGKSGPPLNIDQLPDDNGGFNLGAVLRTAKDAITRAMNDVGRPNPGQVAKNAVDAAKAAATDDASGFADDINTVADPSSSPLDRTLSAGSLARRFFSSWPRGK